MGKPSWAVAIGERGLTQETELGQAVCRCLQQLGHPTQQVFDEDPAGMESAVLLMILPPHGYPGYCRQLRRAGSRRPRVVVWLLDPLPPTGIPADAEAVGLQAVSWMSRLGLPQVTDGVPRWRKLATLVRLREWAYKQLSGVGYRRTCRLIQRSVDGDGRLDWTQVRAGMEAWHWLLKSRREGWVDQVVVSTRQRQQFLAAHDFEVPFVPVGACEEFGRDLGMERDTGVLFLGRVKHGPRAAKLDQIARDLKRTGIAVRVVTGDCYGEARTELLNRTRVLLNLHHYPWSPAWIRFVMAAQCGAAVVSEPCDDQEPFAAGVHYLAAPSERLADAVRKLLLDEKARARVASAAMGLCRQSLTLLNSVVQICTVTQTGHS